MTKFDVVTYMGMGLVLGSQPHPIPVGWSLDLRVAAVQKRDPT